MELSGTIDLAEIDDDQPCLARDVCFQGLLGDVAAEWLYGRLADFGDGDDD